MLIMSLVSWWYGPGWKKVGAILVERAVIAEDYFSIDLLLKTLFSPFRQISADTGRGGTMGDRLRAALDKLFSRLIGVVVRIIIITAGSTWLMINLIVDIGILLIWPVLPFLPVFGLIFSLSGFAPWS